MMLDFCVGSVYLSQRFADFAHRGIGTDRINDVGIVLAGDALPFEPAFGILRGSFL